jgi:hypothetical protein
MVFPTVTETTPCPEAVTRDPFLAQDLSAWTAARTREVAVVVPFSTRGMVAPPEDRVS